MDISDLAQHQIGILGFGQEGQAVLKYLNSHDLKATIFDKTPQEQWSHAAQRQVKELSATAIASVVTGPDYLASIDQCTLLFRSPGVWRNGPEILAAEQRGALVTSQTKWFFEHTPATIIGITGTKGKGTTSSLIYDILKTTDKNVYLTGNIGQLQPLDFLDQSTAEDWVVYELSSFQLQDLTTSPHIGICLMTTSDHLDYHLDLDKYHSAKAAITAFQTSNEDIAIYNSDYPAAVKIGQAGDGKKFAISALLPPTQGAFIQDETISITLNPSSKEQAITIDCSQRKLRGRHNLENIAAAGVVGALLAVPNNKIIETINNFAGLEHRLQLVGKFNGVSYYNDSISTVPETTIAALNSFTEPTHLILGGSDKGLSYDALVKDILQRKNIASITLLGKVGADLEQTFKASAASSPNSAKAIPIFGPYTDFPQAIKAIQGRAKDGDIVLLSPAAASFDMFDSYADRGRKFVELVRN